MTRLQQLAVEGFRLLDERGFVRRRARSAAFAFNGKRDDERAAKIAKLIDAVRKDRPAELTCDELVMELVRRDPTLKPKDDTAYRLFSKQVEEACRAAGVRLTDDADAVTQAMMQKRATEGGPMLSLNPVGMTPCAARPWLMNRSATPAATAFPGDRRDAALCFAQGRYANGQTSQIRRQGYEFRLRRQRQAEEAQEQEAEGEGRPQGRPLVRKLRRRMDFTAPRPTFGAARVAFGQHAQHQEDQKPAPFHGKAAVRRATMFREARELLSALPDPAESLHCIQSGNCDLCVLLMAILDMHPAPCRTLRIATLCYARRNCVELLAALEGKKIGTLTLLASHFFKSHYKELHEWFKDELNAFPGCEIAVARSHAKVVCFDFADGAGLVCEGSANLRSNHNVEQLTLTNDRPLHDFYAAWLDLQVRNDAQDERQQR